MSIDEQDLAARLARVLDAEADAHPRDVADRLRRARLAALTGVPARPSWFGARLAPAAVCSVAIAGFLLFAELPQGPMNPPALFEDELIGAAGADADLIVDLDFYEWLEADGFHDG